MSTPMLSGLTAGLVTEAARIGRGTGGTSYAYTTRDARDRAYAAVEHGAEDWAEVRVHDAPGNGRRPLTFRAWRVSAVSFAWQSATMGAPAFMPYTAHDKPVTDEYGTFCPGCGESLKRLERVR